MSEDNEPSEETVTSEDSENEYQPGAGNAVLDSLFSLDSEDSEAPEAGAEPEPELDPTVPGDQTASSIAMSLTDSLAAIADAPAEEEQEQEQEQEQEEEVTPKPAGVEEEGDDPAATDDYFDKIQIPEATPPAPQEVPPAIAEMTPDERDEYELAAYASRKGNETAEKDYLNFIAKKKEFVARAKQEDPDFTESMDNSEYVEFVSENKPNMPTRERRQLEKAMLKDEVMGEVRQERAQRDAKTEMGRRVPVIQQRSEKFLDELVTEILPEEVRNTLESDGLEVAQVKHSLEMPTLHASLNEAHSAGSTFLQLSNGLVSYDGNNSQHKAILDFVEGQGTVFAKKGGKDRYRDGKKFVPRSTYHQLPNKTEYWTFSDNEILDMIKYFAKNTATERMESVRSKVNSSKSAKPSKKATEPKTPAAPAPAPKARVTKSTGATSSAEEQGSSDNPVLSVLGL